MHTAYQGRIVGLLALLRWRGIFDHIVKKCKNLMKTIFLFTQFPLLLFNYLLTGKNQRFCQHKQCLQSDQVTELSLLSLSYMLISDRNDKSDRTITIWENELFSLFTIECPSSFSFCNEHNDLHQLYSKNERNSFGAFWMATKKPPSAQFWPKKHIQKWQFCHFCHWQKWQKWQFCNQAITEVTRS